MKDIYQIILDLTQRTIQMGHQNYRNHTWCRKYSNFSDLQCMRASSKDRHQMENNYFINMDIVQEVSVYGIIGQRLVWQKIFGYHHGQKYQWPYTIVNFFEIIHIYYTNTPLDAPQSIPRERIHICIYRMVIDGYPCAAYFTGLI